MNSTQNALILLYHRVTAAVRDPQMLCVSPENFRQQMDVLRRRGLKVMALNDLVGAIERNKVPSATVAITFDDGYADNFEQAAPILQSYDAPATIFATTAYTNCDAEFYWDDLDRIFLLPGSLPRYLRLWMADSAIEVDLEDFDYYPHSKARATRSWTVLDKTDPTPRHRAYRVLCQGAASRHCRSGAMRPIRSRRGPGFRCGSRIACSRSIKCGSSLPNGLIDLGGHTIDHPILAVEHEPVQQRQIAGNKQSLAWVLGREPLAFSYPYGTPARFHRRDDRYGQAGGVSLRLREFRGTGDTPEQPVSAPPTTCAELEWHRVRPAPVGLARDVDNAHDPPGQSRLIGQTCFGPRASKVHQQCQMDI